MILGDPIRVGSFKGRNGGPDAKLKWWIGIGGEKGEPSMGEWLSPAKARQLAKAILGECDKVARQKQRETPP